ncbi:MAG: DUF192 domain-containing protein [Candidatus Paceibacterota bacterium]
MNKKKLIVFVLVLAVIATASLFIAHTSVSKSLSVSHPQYSLQRIQAKLGGEAFEVMVASTTAEQELGLGGLTGLKQNEAMIFPNRTSDLYGFWMKDMLFSIDIVWLDENFDIVTVDGSLSPDTYPKIFFPQKPSRYVIELPAGTVERLGVTVGNHLEIEGSL